MSAYPKSCWTISTTWKRMLPYLCSNYGLTFNSKLIVINQFIRDNLKRKSFGLHFFMANRYAEILRGYREDIRRALEVFEVRVRSRLTVCRY